MFENGFVFLGTAVHRNNFPCHNFCSVCGRNVGCREVRNVDGRFFSGGILLTIVDSVDNHTSPYSAACCALTKERE